MKSDIFYIFSILLTIIIGTLLYNYYCCDGAHLFNHSHADNTPVERPAVVAPVHEEVVKTIESNEEVAEKKQDPCKAVFEDGFIVNFESGKAVFQLTTEQQQQLDELAKCTLKLNINLTVTGHTDSTGSAEINLRVGQQRADAIKAILLEKGVPESQVTSVTKGETEPIASNDSEEGKAKNRRITLKSN